MDSKLLEGGAPPWLAMAYSPRRTIRQIVDSNPKRSRTLLASLAGIATVLGQLTSSAAGDRLILPLLLIIAFIGGPLLGVVLNNWLGRLLHWVSSKLGGHGSVEGVRAAYAWSWIPTIWALVLWLPALAMFGSGLFKSTAPTIEAGILRSVAYLGFWVLQLIAGTWSLVLFIASISEVERFSVWRTLAAILLSFLILFAVLFGLGALISGLRF